MGEYIHYYQQALLNARMFRGLSYRQAGKIVGCGGGAYASWEQSGVPPTPRYRTKLFLKLGIPLDCYPEFDYKKFDMILAARFVSDVSAGEFLGVDPTTIHLWRKGETTPRRTKIFELAEALGVAPEVLYHPAERYLK